jgi:hypothetical protein
MLKGIWNLHYFLDAYKIEKIKYRYLIVWKNILIYKVARKWCRNILYFQVYFEWNL